MFLGEFSTLLLADLTHGGHVSLVANQQNDHLTVCDLAQIFQPPRQVFESASTGNVIYQQGADATLIVSLRDGPKILLAGRVPDLDLHVRPVIQLNCLRAEIDADCLVVHLIETIL